MRIVHLNFDAVEKGGATIAMIRIHRALRAQNVDSQIACLIYPDAEGSVLLKRSWFYKALVFFGICVMKVLFRTRLSTGLVPSGIVSQVNALKPDVVVLHWLQTDTISMRELERIKAPILWMHHDLWPVNGLKPHTLLPYWWRWYWPWARIIDPIVRWNKYRTYRKLGARLHPVAASDWCCDEIVKSGAYGKIKPVKIPLSLSESFLSSVHALSKTPRLHTDKFTILNGARDGFSGGLKGGDRLLEALRRLPSDDRAQMRLQILGHSDSKVTDCGMEVEQLGWHPPEELPRFYRAADVFAFPSRQETFGQTKIEALACGTPVVCFDETACAEGVEHLKNGYVAKEDDVDDFVRGLRHYFKLWQEGNECRVGADAVARFSPDVVAKAWIDAANSLIKINRV